MIRAFCLRRLTAVALFAALPPCVAAGAFPAQAASPTTVNVSLNSDIRSLIPGKNRDDNTDAVMLHVVEGLVAYRDNGDVAPLLAEKIDPSADGRTYTFTLRPGVRFHNGATLTAQDVVWNWTRYMDPASEWRCRPDFDPAKGKVRVTGVTAPDPRTVVFTLAEPSALFLTTMARTDCVMTGIMHPDSVKADGSWAGAIGTGPFQLGDWKQGQSITLKKFPGYSSLPGRMDGLTGDKTPLVEEVRFVIIPDASAAKAALLAGDIDVVPDLTNSDALELRENPAVTISMAQTMNMSALLMQTTDPLLGNAKMRQAIALALDTEQMVTAVTQGLVTRNTSLVPTPSSYFGAVQKTGYTQNLKKAQALLAEAGYKGQKISLITNKRYVASFELAVITQAMLQAAGIAVDLEVLEWGTQLDRYSKGNYQMMSFIYSARMDPALSFEAVMGDKATQPRKVWDNPKAQALLSEASTVSDPARRQALFDALHALQLDDAALIPLYNGLEIAGTTKRIKGYKTWAGNKPRLWGVRITN